MLGKLHENTGLGISEEMTSITWAKLYMWTKEAKLNFYLQFSLFHKMLSRVYLKMQHKNTLGVGRLEVNWRFLGKAH